MGDDDLLAESVVTVRAAALALAAPHADQRQQGQQRVVQVGAFAQVGGVGGQRQILEDGDVARRGRPGAFRGCGYRAITRSGVRLAAGHDSSVISRYSAYSANHVITTTAATSRSS